jgi:aspartyl-tRNA(Asn)/glutamyl-tRNA(Gln) amidotransferase subunit A
MQNGPTLAGLAAQLAQGSTTSRALVEQCLGRIEDPAGEGSRAFMLVMREQALAAADAIDQLRKAGVDCPPNAGIPVSIKDLFDISGQVTRAGSKALADAPAATADAATVARLRRAGFIVIGRTNMTEFAFSGVGLNPHYGTPKSIWDRETGRIPGGSSSGAAVSVADGMAHMGLGTDTGGSCRIPAAFNGIVGFKPTAIRVPTTGAIPLSTTLDSIGPLARTVACCAAVDSVLAGQPLDELRPLAAGGLRLAVAKTIMLGDMDATVAKDLERTLSRLSAAGAWIEHVDVPAFGRIPQVNAKGGFSAPEALAWHKALIERKGGVYDPRVLVRIQRGSEQSGVDYVELVEARRQLVDAFEAQMEDYDALLMPTVPMVAPPISALDKDEDYARINLLALRNPSFINVVDGCAISLPMHRQGEAPTGLMAAAARGRDRHLLRVAAGIEAVLKAA